MHIDPEALTETQLETELEKYVLLFGVAHRAYRPTLGLRKANS
jgi:hypothetical protein